MLEHAAIFIAAKTIIIPPFIALTILLSKIQPEISAYECIWASFPLGYVIASWLSYIVSCIFGETSALSVRFTYTLLTPVFLYCLFIWYKKYDIFRKQLLQSILKENILHFLVFFSSIYFGFIYFTHILLEDSKGALWSGGAIWSDIAFHLNVINTFLYGKNKHISLFTQPQSVIFDGHPLSYPFIPDYHSATLVAAGAFNTRWAILIPSFFIMLSLIVLLFCFIRRFLENFSANSIDEKQLKRDDNISYHIKSPIQSKDAEACLAVCLWLLSGGIGGWTMLRDRPFTWSQIVNEDWMQKTSSSEELYWFSCVSHVLLPQRSALFAYPLSILVFSCIFTAFNQQKVSDETKRNLFRLSGVIVGLLPLVHAHSFLAVNVILFIYALIEWRKSFDFTKNGYFWLWFSYGMIILLVGLPQIAMYKSRLIGGENEGHSSFVAFAPLWRNYPWRNYWKGETMLPLDFNFFVLWWKALGFMVPLAVLSTFILNSTQRKIIFCFWVIFIMANLIQFQPWDKDNNKIFLIWLMLPVGAVAALLLKLFRKNILLKVLVVILIFSLVISGILMALRETDLWWQFMDKEDQNFAEWVKHNTESDSVFIVNDSHIHPVTNLAGRSAVFNMAGWVQSHGYPNMWERQSELRRMLSSGDSVSYLWDKYKVDYIAFDWRLTYDYPTTNRNFFDTSPRVTVPYRTDKYTIYDVRGLQSQF